MIALCLGTAERSWAEKTEIDMLIVYTHQVDQYYEGERGVLAQVFANLASANEAFESSGVDIELRLAGLRRTEYVESSEALQQDLLNLAQGLGALGAVPAWRNETGADLVCLFRSGSQKGGGIAVILRDRNGNDHVAFTVVDSVSSLGNYIFAHEVGHNLGAAHTRANSPTEGLFSYSYGHRFTDSDQVQRRTIMAYQPGDQTGLFSNPKVLYNGAPTGVEAGQPAEADNARTFNFSGPLVAAYRQRANTGPFLWLDTRIQAEDTEGLGLASVTLDGSAAYSVAGIAKWEWNWEGGSASGETVEVDFPVGETRVTLKVTDKAGQATTAELLVTVVQGGPFKSVSVGDGFALAVTEGGALHGFGKNWRGQLGLGGREDASEFKLVPTGPVKQAAAGYQHSVLLMRDGTVQAMGSNSSNALGDGTRDDRYEPAQVPIEGVVSVAAGANRSFYLKSDGSLWGAGDGLVDIHGQTSWSSGNVPILLVEGGVKSIVAGWEHALIVMDDGSLWGLGMSPYGQLGYTSGNERRRPVQILASGVLTAAAGFNHTLILKEDGSLWALGRNHRGQLGTGDRETRAEATLVWPEGVTDIAAGENASLFKTQDGRLWAMGTRASSKFGAGDWSVPRPIINGRIVDFAIEREFFVIKDDGSIWGAIPLYSGGDRLPTEPFTLPRQLAVNQSPAAKFKWTGSVADRDFDGRERLRLDADGSSDDWEVASWEWSWSDSYASGETITLDLPVGETVVRLTVTDDEGAQTSIERTIEIRDYQKSPVKRLFGGRPSIFFLHECGMLTGAGNNFYGQLGFYAGRTHESSPIVVLEDDVEMAAVGENHSLFLRSDGSVWGVGRGGRGQLGPEGAVDNPVPFEVIDGGVRFIAAGDSVSFAITYDGALLAFGENFWGQRGDGFDYGRPHPFPVFESGVSKVSASSTTTLVVLDDGSVWGMGLLEPSLLADPASDPQAGPVLLIRSGVRDVHARFNDLFYYIKEDGSLWQRESREGDTLLLREDVRKVAVGYAVLALREDGSVWGKGRNERGTLGDGTGEWQDEFVKIHYGGAVDIGGIGHYPIILRENGEIWGTGYDLRGRSEEGALFSRDLTAGRLEISGEVINAPPTAVIKPARIVEQVRPWETERALELDASASRDDWQIVEWKWTWPDGEAHGRKVQPLLPLGQYDLTLTVTDHLGLVSSISVPVSIVRTDDVEGWLSAYFSDDEVAAGFEALLSKDSDGDGLSNRFERLLKLDPTNSQERLYLSVVETSERGLAVRVRGSRSHQYIDLWASVDAMNWTRWTGYRWTNGGDMFWDLGETSRFFQVRLSEEISE